MLSLVRMPFGVALCLAFLLSSLLSPATSLADDPQPQTLPAPLELVVGDSLSEWTLAEGLAYWALHCGGSITNGYLRRQPANGGSVYTMSSSTSPDCQYFHAMTADAEALYYYGGEGEGVFRRRIDDPSATPSLILDLSEAWATPNYLQASGDHVYMSVPQPEVLASNGSPSGEASVDAAGYCDDGCCLARARKDGTGVDRVADTTCHPTQLAVVDGMVYWTDEGGLWRTTVTCGTLPCNKTQLDATGGTNLLYYEPAYPWHFQVYWVTGTSPQRIRRYGCWNEAQPYPNPPLYLCAATNLRDAPSTHHYIGQLRTDGASLFWTEYDSLTQTTSVRRMPIDGGTADEIAVVGQVYRGLYTDNRYLYFAGWVQGSPGIYRLPFDAAAIQRDLVADALEVTQGIQNLAHDVELVAKKTTYVRAYARQASGPTTVAVDAYLYGTRGGSALPGSPLHPVRGWPFLEPGGTYDRAILKDGLLFQLPSAWTAAGTVKLRLVVDPQAVYTDPDTGNNQISRDVTFHEKSPVCTVFIPVRTHTEQYTRPSDNPNFGAMIDMARRLWPVYDIWTYYQTSDIAETQVCWWGPVPYPCFGPYEVKDDAWQILGSVGARNFFSDDPDECDDSGAETHYIGMIHPDADSGTTSGLGSTVSMNAWVKFAPHAPTISADWYWPDAGGDLAHEMSHNHGRKHVACTGKEDDTDSGYLYPTTQIDNVGAANHYGFDTKTWTPIAPDGAADLMGYCRPRWTSDYTWGAIYDRLHDGSLQTVEAQIDLASADAAVYVSGAVTPSLITGTLDYAWVYPTAELGAGILQKWQNLATFSAGASLQASSFRVRLLAADGTVLAEQEITLEDLADDPPTDPTLPFVTTFAAPAGAVSRVELVQDGTVLASRSPGAGLPVVSVSQPAGGETIGEQMQLTWLASEPDGDTLLYNVQYSPDGGATWIAMLPNYPGTGGSTTTSLLVSNLQIPASLPGQGLIRVAASDGYHTAVATSAPFTVSNRAPTAYLGSPGEGATLPAGEAVVLSGGGSDAEDGGLSGNDLTWSVDGQPSGSGDELLVDGLAPGEHTATLIARDSKALGSTAQAAFTVLPLSIPEGSAPLLDGFCEDTAYAGGIQLRLAPYAGGNQAVVHLLRSSSHLWACFSGMDRGSGGVSPFAGLRIDANNSHDALAQADDYGFFAGEDGGFFTYSGDGVGGFTQAGPGGLQAMVSANASAWSAELRIDGTTAGGRDQLVSMSLGYYGARFEGDENEWPFNAVWNQPDTWASSALAELPKINQMNRQSATVGGPAFVLTVDGEYFQDGAVLRWDEVALPTTWISSSQLTAGIGTEQIATARLVDVVVRNPGGDALDSNRLVFTVSNPVPQITSLNPGVVLAGSTGLDLMVIGTGYASGAQVLWNGESLPTTYESSTQVRAQVNAGLISAGQTVGVAVRNPDAGGSISNVFSLVVEPRLTTLCYLPLVMRNY